MPEPNSYVVVNIIESRGDFLSAQRGIPEFQVAAGPRPWKSSNTDLLFERSAAERVHDRFGDARVKRAQRRVAVGHARELLHALHVARPRRVQFRHLPADAPARNGLLLCLGHIEVAFINALPLVLLHCPIWRVNSWNLSSMWPRLYTTDRQLCSKCAQADRFGLLVRPISDLKTVPILIWNELLVAEDAAHTSQSPFETHFNQSKVNQSDVMEFENRSSLWITNRYCKKI